MEWPTNRSICSLGGITWRLITIMASNAKRSVASALNSLSGDGIFFPSADDQNVEALIEEYFNESEESGSDDDEECSKEFITYITRIHSN